MSEQINVFCDGSCRRNGKPGAKAGYGIYVTKNGKPYHSHSAVVPGEDLQTNQRAELLALHYALQYIAESGIRGSTIYSDSKYSIQCLTVWSKAWRAAGWKKADKKVISHVDIIPAMCELWDSISEFTQLVHVFGHTGGTDAISVGNAEADRLANEATA
jgi:ribonuclease HI